MGSSLDAIMRAFLVRWEAESRCGAEPSRLHTPEGQADHRHLALDGKTIRATNSQPHPVHQLSCYEVATGIVLWHCNVEQKENEISALKPLLTSEYVTGRILTLDAMHTQRALCTQVHRLGGHYLLLAKDNQPTLRADIADLLRRSRPRIDDAGKRPKPGTKRMDGWSIATSCAVLTSMTGLARSGQALSRSFGSNAPCASSKPTTCVRKSSMG